MARRGCELRKTCGLIISAVLLNCYRGRVMHSQIFASTLSLEFASYLNQRLLRNQSFRREPARTIANPPWKDKDGKWLISGNPAGKGKGGGGQRLKKGH